MGPEELKVIVIDYGHDKDDPGSVQYDGEYERDYTIDLGHIVRDELLANYKCKVLSTHEGEGAVPGPDVDKELRGRAAVANENKADLLVSLHHDSGPLSARGGSLWIWSSKGMHLSVNDHTDPKTYPIAKAMEPILKETWAEIGIPWRGMYSSDFGILRYTVGPAVLIETHFGSNPQDDELMDIPVNRRRMGAGIARAIAAALDLPRKIPFTDVPSNAWYLQDAVDLYEMGILRGDPDGKLRPDDPATRAEMIRLVRLAIRYMTGR